MSEFIFLCLGVLFGWLATYIFMDKKAKERPKVQAEGAVQKVNKKEHSLVILDPVMLSFYKDSTLKSSFGLDIPIVGIGQTGVTLQCYYAEQEKTLWVADNKGSSIKWQFPWEAIMEHFPEYAHEIKQAAMSPEERELLS